MKVSELFEAVAKERSVLSVMGSQPDHVESFYCCQKKITSLKGSPSKVSKFFDCYDNKLTSLEGAPVEVGVDFSCHTNSLKSLHNIHKQIKHIGGRADFDHNLIESHVLGLILIDGLKAVLLDNKKVQIIINKYLKIDKKDRDVFACQDELIENGFEEYAQL